MARIRAFVDNPWTLRPPSEVPLGPSAVTQLGPRPAPIEDEIVAEYPSVTVAGVRAAAAYGASLAREDIIPLGEAG